MSYASRYLTLAYLAIGLASLVILFSISPDRLAIQAISLTTGFALYLFLSRQDPAFFASLSKPAYLFTVFLLILTFFLGENVRGSVRWIPFGDFNLQTSELAKPLLTLFFASYLAKHPPHSFRAVARYLLFLAIPLFLIFQQPDLGTTLVIMVIALGQLLIAGLPVWIFALGSALTAATARYSTSLLKDYQLRRLEAFLDPSRDPLGSGYNVIQSQIAIGSGGFFGKGLGHGTQSHLRFLPERHTDFVFASLVEELGILGGIFVLAALGLILWQLASFMLTPTRTEYRLFLAGTFSYLLFQTFVNIGMNLGIAPVTGVTLPLVSYGGSSILAISLSLGIAGAIANSQSQQELTLEIK